MSIIRWSTVYVLSTWCERVFCIQLLVSFSHVHASETTPENPSQNPASRCHGNALSTCIPMAWWNYMNNVASPSRGGRQPCAWACIELLHVTEVLEENISSENHFWGHHSTFKADSLSCLPVALTFALSIYIKTPKWCTIDFYSLREEVQYFVMIRLVMCSSPQKVSSYTDRPTCGFLIPAKHRWGIVFPKGQDVDQLMMGKCVFTVDKEDIMYCTA